MVGSLPSSSIVSTQQLQVVHLYVLSMGVSRYSPDYSRLPFAARLTVCIYVECLKYYMPYYDEAYLVTVIKTKCLVVM